MNLLNLFRKPAGLKELSPLQIQQIMASPAKHAVIDVRTPMEFSSGHIPGSLSYPLGKEANAARRLKPETPIILLCKSGHRSQAAAYTFAKKGFTDISHLAGGMDLWKKEKLPIEK